MALAVERAVDVAEVFIGDVRVDLCCGNVRMPEKRLNGTEICHALPPALSSAW